MGVHSCTVGDMHTPYIMPSESGGRADVQWVKLSKLDKNKAATSPTYSLRVSG